MSKQLSKYLRNLREAKGLSTRQVAARTQCSQASITRFETGDRFPSLVRLWEIVTVLEGDFGEALTLYCIDSGIPKEVARKLISSSRLTRAEKD